MLFQILATIAACAAAWTSGYWVGQARQCRFDAAKGQHPATSPDSLHVPDSPADLPDPDIDCTCGGAHADENAVLTANSLLTANQTAMRALDAAGAAPSAVIVCVPSPSTGGTVAMTAMHPDAYPDSSVLARELTALAGTISSRQGQINEDLHHLRDRGDQR